MNIEFSKREQVTYKELAPGEFFTSSHGDCINTNSGFAVRIRDGAVTYFINDCMVTRIKTKEEAQQISRGSCFWYKGSYYMALTPIESYPLHVCAVDLSSGQTTLIGNSVMVIPVDAKVVVEE